MAWVRGRAPRGPLICVGVAIEVGMNDENGKLRILPCDWEMFFQRRRVIYQQNLRRQYVTNGYKFAVSRPSKVPKQLRNQSVGSFHSLTIITCVFILPMQKIVNSSNI